MRRAYLPLLAGVLLAGAAPAPPASAQETAVRFEMASVADTMFSFDVGRYQWIARGLEGIVVDPRRRDVLIARFQVQSVRQGIAWAVVTGQAAPLASHHAVLITRPPTRWYRQPYFWVGAALGAAAGFVIGSR